MQQSAGRKWPRLREHDYSSDGYYFITVCTKDKAHLLSSIRTAQDGAAFSLLTEYGRTAESFLVNIPGIDQYVIMPNHIHMIIHKTDGKSIANDIRAFKGLVTKKIGKGIWQDYYYDHIIRNEDDYQTKCKYIAENPAKWAEDAYYS